MSVVPMVSIAALERDVLRARRADRAHYARCTVIGGTGGPAGCEKCDRYTADVRRTEARLACAASQRPDRQIPVDGADRRRAERSAQEAA